MQLFGLGIKTLNSLADTWCSRFRWLARFHSSSQFLGGYLRPTRLSRTVVYNVSQFLGGYLPRIIKLGHGLVSSQFLGGYLQEEEQGGFLRPADSQFLGGYLSYWVDDESCKVSYLSIPWRILAFYDEAGFHPSETNSQFLGGYLIGLWARY